LVRHLPAMWVPSRSVPLRDDGRCIIFFGVLESYSRGLFEYEGLVREGGVIEGLIRLERKQWDWTSAREIAFQGAAMEEFDPQRSTKSARNWTAWTPPKIRYATDSKSHLSA
jgi:hypothetical protein